MVKISDNNIKFIIGEKSLENLAYEIRLEGCDKPMLVCDDMARRLGYKSILLKAFEAPTPISTISTTLSATLPLPTTAKE